MYIYCNIYDGMTALMPNEKFTNLDLDHFISCGGFRILEIHMNALHHNLLRHIQPYQHQHHGDIVHCSRTPWVRITAK